MREGIGSLGIFTIVITLILIFAAVVALTINHNNAFAVKDAIVSIIESNEGFKMNTDLSKTSQKDEKDYKALKAITESLKTYSYRQTGYCPKFESSKYKVKGYDRKGEQVGPSKRASFCIVRIEADPKSSGSGGIPVYYYQVYVFYSLDVPVLRQAFAFKAVGETKPLYY